MVLAVLGVLVLLATVTFDPRCSRSVGRSRGYCVADHLMAYEQLARR